MPKGTLELSSVTHLEPDAGLAIRLPEWSAGPSLHAVAAIPRPHIEGAAFQKQVANRYVAFRSFY